MNILFGIQGTGNGHVSRSTQIIHHLKALGAHVDVLFSGCDEDKVFDRTIIDSCRFFKGFTFNYRNGRISTMDTLRNLSIYRFLKNALTFDPKGYDLVVTDFEPLTSLISKRHNIPSIGIGHQYAFLHDIPMAASGHIDRAIMKYFASADVSIGLHWHHFNQPIAPPVINANVHISSEIVDNLVLVYLPFESDKEISAFLQKADTFKFAVYSGHSGKGIRKEGHITWHPFSKKSFYEHLSVCSGVICNAGFELPSEALHLGKKILAKPLIGQFEQASNAKALEWLKLGTTMDFLDSSVLKSWLTTESFIKTHYPNVADLIARWIVKGSWDNTRELVNQAWTQ